MTAKSLIAASLVAEALAAGKVRRVEAGVSGLSPRKTTEPEMKIRPEHCGPGGSNGRHRFLEEIEGDWS